MPLDEALAQAYAKRADYKAARELLKADEARRRRRLGQLAPSVHLAADYGSIGNSWSVALGHVCRDGQRARPHLSGGP